MTEQTRSAWPDPVLAVLATAVTAAPGLALFAVFEVVSDCLLGCTQQSDNSGYLTAALILGTVVATAGIMVATYTNRLGWRWWFGVVLTLTMLLSLLAWMMSGPVYYQVPPPSPPGCQEHSGGDNRCPGD